MRTFIAAAIVALAMTGSAFGPTNHPVNAQTDTVIDQIVDGDENVSNTFHTRDNGPNNDGQEDSGEDQQQQCKCLVWPAAAPSI